VLPRSLSRARRDCYHGLMPPIRLAFTSDLHLPITSAPAIADLARAVAAFAPAVLVVAGDVAESLPELERCLATLKGLLDCPVWVLPGNHDLWCRSARSQRLWEELLPQTVAAAGCRWLEGSSFVVDGVGVAGTIAWYDYSAADPAVQESPRTFAEQKRHFNMDAVMIDWAWSDADFAARVAGPFLAALDRLETDPAVRQTVVATHVPLLECQMLRRPDNRDWGFSNAYFGNLTLGRQVVARKKVTHVISGHTHIERQGQVRSEAGRVIEARVLASDYSAPAWLGLTLPDHT
jgi:3',5'-cyclic AMP phosphodiesterase CpdA